MRQGAFYTGEYRNVFRELGYGDDEIKDRIEQTFQTMFYGDEAERIYHPVGNDMAYILDTGNLDVRTEGMSYGMMMCVQLNRKAEFDRIWKWAKTYMYHDDDTLERGYFAWSCRPDGTRKSEGAAPDGEEYFTMALFFASHRWGDGEGIYNYSKEVCTILRDCIHKGEQPGTGHPMWDPGTKLIKFVANCNFTDASYHLPHFYELFALWADEADRQFWQEAADASRAFLKKACHPVTGLNPELSEFDGTPLVRFRPGSYRRDLYYSDAYRTIANIAMDYAWFSQDLDHPEDWRVEIADKLQHFFCHTVRHRTDGIYELDGRILPGKALHPVAITATNAHASLAAKGPYWEECARKLWDTPLRSGDRRYYDNCLYMFALLALSGNYRIYGVGYDTMVSQG
ncbi:MAG TPA: glycosyl hydrolase family 8 [Limnochordia bacterium]|nr:glycosyl hydrolase family 8 [Limnochordia bacterium]